MTARNNAIGSIGVRRMMVFIDGGYLRKYLRDMFNTDIIDFSKLAELIKDKTNSPHIVFELIRVYYYDAIVEIGDTVKYGNQESYFQNIRKRDYFDVRLGRLKKDGSGKYKQKGVDTLIAIDMLTKAYSNHFDIAVLLAGDDDFLEVVTAVKNTGKQVFGIYFVNHISTQLIEVFDQKIVVDKSWLQTTILNP